MLSKGHSTGGKHSLFILLSALSLQRVTSISPIYLPHMHDFLKTGKTFTQWSTSVENATVEANIHNSSLG